MLKFIGCGSAFNTNLGNNSAYIKDDNRLFMLDCGSANFDRIIRSSLLLGVDNITVLMTHLHPDHVGSLGDLIFYMYMKVKPLFVPKVTVFTPDGISRNFLTLMDCVGVREDQFRHIEIAGKYEPENLLGISQIIPVPVTHVRELTCYAYLLKIQNKQVYYSGDANMIPEEVLNSLKNGEIDFFYQDTSKADYEGNVHLSLRKLTELIPSSLRHKVYCMHLDETFSVEEANRLGFNVVKCGNSSSSDMGNNSE